MKTKAQCVKGVVPAQEEVLPEEVAEQKAPAEIRLPRIEQQEPGPGPKERLGNLAAGIGQIKAVDPPVKVRPERSYERPVDWFE
jgi:hypothetical protein